MLGNLFELTQTQFPVYKIGLMEVVQKRVTSWNICSDTALRIKPLSYMVLQYVAIWRSWTIYVE